MTAYDILKEGKLSDPITWEEFYALIAQFREGILEEAKYLENLELHRNPVEVKNAMLQKLSDAHRDLQNRPEMRDHDEKTKTLGYVPSVIKELWKSDKRIKSLYAAIGKYAALRNKDFNLIAVHIAEYRAINQLLTIVKKNLHRKPHDPDTILLVRRYNFEDWLQNKFYQEKTATGEYVANDSNKYAALVTERKMSSEALKKIEAAQQRVYEYIVNLTVRTYEQEFQKQVKDQKDIGKLITAKHSEVTQFLKKNQADYNRFLETMREPLRAGAKFLLPEYYAGMLEKKTLTVESLPPSTYSLAVNGQPTTFPTQEQLREMVIDVQVRWMKVLQAKKEKRRLDEMLSCEDFKELIDRYGEGDILMEHFKKGLGFAPDREVYIKRRIETFESVLTKYQSSVHAWDSELRQQIQVQTGEYRRIGFAWVNSGHNAQPSDLRSITYNNTIAAGVPPEGRYSIFMNILHQLATGGAIAFHVAYLRKQLNKPDRTRLVRTIKAPDVWQATEAQRIRLFEELNEESFVRNTAGNKKNFLKNKPVQWMQDGRSLFYLLEALKRKKYGGINFSENLGPLVRENFLNKNGEPYKNISQNKSGMNIANKAGKPRLAERVDAVLERVFKS